MASPFHHALLALALAGSLFASCGGRTADVGGGMGSSGGSSGGSGGSSGGSSGGTTASSSGVSGTSSGGGSGTSSGGVSGTSSGGPSPSCIYIDPSTFDQSCSVPSDCFVISSGKICTGSCLCGGGAAINVAEETRYENEISAVSPAACPCPPPPPPVCSGHKCLVCTGAPTDPPECFGPPPPVEAGVFCKQGPSGGGSSGSNGGGCSIQTSESCTDGTTYNVSCSCPDAICTCSQQSGNGGSSSGGFPFKGCAAGCTPNALPLAYEACGFPLPL